MSKNFDDITQSEESNNMDHNYPDIETIEEIREQTLEKKEIRKQTLEKKEIKELNKLLRIEEKTMAKEQKRIKKEMKIKEKEQRRFIEIEEKRIKQEEKRKKTEEIKEEKQKRLEEKKLAEEKKKETALKGMKYLLNISEKYSDFFREKLNSEKLGSTTKVLQERNKLQPTLSDIKQGTVKKPRKSQNKEDVDVTQKLKFFEGGELRQYQIDGVQWMNTLFENGINGILADEMGLGKTVQVIALTCHLLERGIPGPYLIVAPLSTIPNWEAEFKRFAPQVPVFVLHGNVDERRMQFSLIKKKYAIGDFHTRPVVLTTYQMPLLEKTFLSRFQWQYITIDEGHRIKNHESRLSIHLRNLNSANRLLLTGTPIHNNITELWSLLNFLMPHIFHNVDTFASLLLLDDMKDENKLIEQEQRTNLLSTLHKVLEPFVLRRLKKDVLGDNVPKKEAIIFCPLSKLQRDLYSQVLNNNISLLLKQDEKEEAALGPRRKRKRVCYYVDNQTIEKEMELFVIRLTMGNPMMMFQKIVNHPYLVHFPLDPNAQKKSLLINEDLVTSSGKMIVLDEMLERLKENGHKVLIFSTLVMAIDLIEELFIMRGNTYCRLDGSHGLEERKESIDRFNNDANILAFLLSTRAGGLGLNLTGADTVIFFDRDWNPQADIQAQDRCHRIGQTRPVMVYTLVSKGTIDEQIIETGRQKRLLEKVVIKDGKFHKAFKKKTDVAKLQSELEELQNLLQEENDHHQALASSIEEMEKLLDRSDLYAQMNLEKK